MLFISINFLIILRIFLWLFWIDNILIVIGVVLMITTSLLILFFLLLKWLFFIKIGDFDKILSVFLDAKLDFLVVDVEDAVEVAEEDVAEEDHGNITKHLRKSRNSQNAIPFQLSVQSFTLD